MSIDPTAAIPDATFDAPVVVNTDINCRKCGYNLRGLSTDSRCPECGTAVAYSVKGDFIRYSDPAWVLRLRSGALMILAGIGVIILGVIVIAVLAGLTSRSAGGPATTVVVLGALITLAGQGLIIYGTWQLTEPDPSGLGEDQYGKIRKFIRIALLVGIAGTILDLMSNALSLPLPFMQMLAVVQGLAGLVGIIGFCCQLIYLSRLTMRLPDDAMSRRAKSLAWTIGISYGVVFVVGIIAALIVSGGTPGGGLAVLGCAGGIFGLAVLIAGIMYLLLLERFAKRMKAEAEMARQTWAR